MRTTSYSTSHAAIARVIARNRSPISSASSATFAQINRQAGTRLNCDRTRIESATSFRNTDSAKVNDLRFK